MIPPIQPIEPYLNARKNARCRIQVLIERVVIRFHEVPKDAQVIARAAKVFYGGELVKPGEKMMLDIAASRVDPREPIIPGSMRLMTADQARARYFELFLEAVSHQCRIASGQLDIIDKPSSRQYLKTELLNWVDPKLDTWWSFSDEMRSASPSEQERIFERYKDLLWTRAA